MEIKTAELTGKPLSWVLAKALNKRPALSFEREVVVSEIVGWQLFDYADPATCMGLIDLHKIDINHRDPLRLDRSVLASWGDPNDFAYGYFSARGKTLAEAVARCVVAMRLGDEVEIPDELCGVQS